MSIRLEVNNGAMVRDLEFTEGMTVGDLIQNFKNENGFRFNDTPKVQDASQGPVMSLSDVIMDHRTYTMQVWIQSKVGEDGLTDRQRQRGL